MHFISEAMEANLAEHFSFVQRRVPGMFVDDRSDLLIVDSGLPTDTFNKILRTRLSIYSLEDRIEQAIAHFRDAGRPFAWWVGPLSRPSDLERHLQAHGLRAAESEDGMTADLTRIPNQVEVPPGLEIRRVRTREELDDFAAVNAANWKPPDPLVIEFFRMAAPVLLAESCRMQLFVGYCDGVGAAASELMLTGNVAGVHMVSTRSEYRRRGFGLALTWSALDAGRRAGATLAALQASEAGRPVYERLGFTTCGRFVEYTI